MEKSHEDNQNDVYNTKFKGGKYNEDYYQDCDHEKSFWLKEYFDYFSTEFKQNDSGHQLLDFGCGPVVIFPGAAIAASLSTSITYADLVQDNRKAVSDWMEDSKDAFDWGPCLEFLEKLSNKKSSVIKSDLRAAFKEVVYCDVNDPMPIHGKNNYFDTIITNVCLEGACVDHEHMKQGIKNIRNMLKPGGIFLWGGILELTNYGVNEHSFPACSLKENDIKEMFKDPEIGMQVLKLNVQKGDVRSGVETDHSGVFFLVAQKTVPTK